MIRPHTVSAILSSVTLISNLSSYVAEGELAGVVEDALARRRIILLMPTGAISAVFLALTFVGVDGDVCGVSFMGGNISATFLAAHPLPCLGILCRKAQIAG